MVTLLTLVSLVCSKTMHDAGVMHSESFICSDHSHKRPTVALCEGTYMM